jgi:hypothetical protein
MKDKESSPAAVAWKAKAVMNGDEIRYNKDIIEQLAKLRGSQQL